MTNSVFRRSARHLRSGRAAVAGVILLSAVTTSVAFTGSAVADVAPSTYHVVASKKSVTDSHGTVWQPDSAFAKGGSLNSSGASVSGTASQQLYRPQRSGTWSYAFPVTTAGTYSVVLYLAELNGKNPGQRVYDVNAEGAAVATGVDVSAAIGKNAAWHVPFTVPVTDGTININFIPRVGQAVVSAVDVEYVHPELTTTTTFDDEFDGAAGTIPDDTKWTQDFVAGANHELEVYTANNSFADGAGNMVLEARHEPTLSQFGVQYDYSSARLTTQTHFSFLYGRAEARILTPAGQGLWPAFWATGDDGTRWPTNGEIDAMEEKGQQPSTDWGTVHGVTTAGTEWKYGRTVSGAPLAGSWHTYATVWQPGVVSTLLDGRPFMTVTPADLPSADVWPFSHPFRLLLDLAVGGDFLGPPSTSTLFPADMKVDWVRVTQ